jgi:hypothetical protein
MMRPVANRDSAFLWETEVLRSARRPAGTVGGDQQHSNDGDDWLTVREASEATGVPPSTIRKWARHDNIPSYLEKTEDGYLRIVSMSGIRDWADEIGREVGDAAAGAGTGVEEIDLSEEERPGPGPEVPEGTMLVPLDAWNKMLNQLGNLHQAGQQLAEARERAAKAETEAIFLRERLRELRSEVENRGETETASAAETGVDDPQTGSTGSLLRKIYSDWRRYRRK